MHKLELQTDELKAWLDKVVTDDFDQSVQNIALQFLPRVEKERQCRFRPVNAILDRFVNLDLFSTLKETRYGEANAERSEGTVLARAGVWLAVEWVGYSGLLSAASVKRSEFPCVASGVGTT